MRELVVTDEEPERLTAVGSETLFVRLCEERAQILLGSSLEVVEQLVLRDVKNPDLGHLVRLGLSHQILEASP